MKRIQKKALKEAHNQGLCNYVDAAISETEHGAAVILSSRSDMLTSKDHINTTINAAETYNQDTLQYLETFREEDLWSRGLQEPPRASRGLQACSLQGLLPSA